MGTEFIIIILVVIYLRRALKAKLFIPEWHDRLQWLLYASIGLLVAQAIVDNFRIALHWVGMIMLGWLLYQMNKNEKFKEAKFLVTAITPYLVVAFVIEVIRLIDVNLYNEWKSWTDAIQTFAVIWGVGTWIVTRRQRKELIKAKQKAIEEEENNKVISAMKAQLEVQVAERTAELRKQKEELEVTLDELRAAQTQLIQSEKMASLGELTAGIAHEIQNPLNFVNNFSEVNKELLTEMKHEIDVGNLIEAKNIAKDIEDNEEKITYHGKRADAIVKSMLQHSRSSSGKKEPTDINALADEYLRLAYHGLRAKDKSFNAKFETDFDDRIGQINIVHQDIGRVLLNLINNAFYSVSEKQKQDIPGYEPTITVATKKMGDSRVELSVADNGNGVPKKVLDKIFQPFFTTKPTGLGTGLGLSLSYDIITRGHNGELKVETKEGEGAEFIIILPTQ
ncbi:MAG TPA: ATP-binding protein [Chitinophagaceae bacterium]|nr:ATP-binding protein [Chitinophagaceae bacterium]